MDAADVAQQDTEVLLAARASQAHAALARPGAQVCTECEQPIPEERRRAMPSATRCVACQAVFERLKNNNGR